MIRYSLVLLDVDGTLLDTRGGISPNTQKLLQTLEKRGIPVVLCSNRPPAGIAAVQREAGIHGPTVCYGGSLILDDNGSLWADTGIGRETALAFKKYAETAFPEGTVTSFLYNVCLTDSAADPYVRTFPERYGCDVVEGSLASAVRAVGHVHKFLCMGRPQLLREARDQCGRKFPDLALFLSGLSRLEVLAGHVSRRTALETVCRRYGVDLSHAVAVGTSFEDLDMIRAAGLGIAMGNAPEAVREAADRVTASNDDEGVYIALKKLRFHAPGTET